MIFPKTIAVKQNKTYMFLNTVKYQDNKSDRNKQTVKI